MSSKWQQQPNRHYCALCNVWMANDRISIATHENGRKHKEAVEKDLQSRRADKLEEERRKKDMEDSLRAIEAAAGKKLEEDLGGGAFAGYSYSHAGGVAAVHVGLAAGATASYPPSATAQAQAQPIAGPGSIHRKQQPDASAKKEMSSWNERKNKRKQAAAADGRGGEGTNDGDHADGGAAAAAKRQKVRKLAADEGHYTLGEGDDKRTYLEGKVYAPILEEEMPVQIWIGDDDAPTSSMEQEMKRDDRQHLWKMGLVVKVRKLQKKQPTAKGGFIEEGAESHLRGNDNYEEEIAVDVAYLRNSNDEDETIEKAVQPHRLRLLLGSDEMIPGTIEEARLDLMGGEEIIETHADDGTAGGAGAAAPIIDENTGLATWSTTTVRKVSANREAKEERARIRAKRREEAERARQQERDLNERKMEEAKVANADDSALGSYDVWTGGKAGYKGVDIMKNDKIEVSDTAKSLAKGKGTVAFKKVGSGSLMFKAKAKKKKNRRVTSADDDDD